MTQAAVATGPPRAAAKADGSHGRGLEHDRFFPRSEGKKRVGGLEGLGLGAKTNLPPADPLRGRHEPDAPSLRSRLVDGRPADGGDPADLAVRQGELRIPEDPSEDQELVGRVPTLQVEPRILLDGPRESRSSRWSPPEESRPPGRGRTGSSCRSRFRGSAGRRLREGRALPPRGSEAESRPRPMLRGGRRSRAREPRAHRKPPPAAPCSRTPPAFPARGPAARGRDPARRYRHW